mmetsp:Transcript_11554/g.27207  ORF Transcript_11554/g.27207 Transcript_11554/m.27207 type:complete len:245 (+) Transcript_11554:885-1619(+)
MLPAASLPLPLLTPPFPSSSTLASRKNVRSPPPRLRALLPLLDLVYPHSPMKPRVPFPRCLHPSFPQAVSCSLLPHRHLIVIFHPCSCRNFVCPGHYDSSCPFLSLSLCFHLYLPVCSQHCQLLLPSCSQRCQHFTLIHHPPMYTIRHRLRKAAPALGNARKDILSQELKKPLSNTINDVSSFVMHALRRRGLQSEIPSHPSADRVLPQLARKSARKKVSDDGVEELSLCCQKGKGDFGRRRRQ